MNVITVLKVDLVEKIKANMDTHQETYDTAVEEFNRQQTQLLEELVAKARAGKSFDRLALSRMAVPENHMDDYRRALAMLEMEINDKVELTEHEFQQLVLDEWEWRRSFTANTVAYAAAASMPH